MDPTKITNNLRRIREERNLSQQEAADLIGLSRNAYRKLENGETVAVNKNIEAFAAAMGVSVAECLFDSVPSERMEMELREKEDRNEQLRTMVQFYEKRLEDMQNSLNQKDDIIRTLNEINARLASNIGKN